MTRKWSRAVVDVGVGYGSDLDRALSVFRDEAARFVADPGWQRKFDGEPEIAGVNGLNESAVTIRTLLRTHPGQQWAVEREFRRRIKNRLDREGIEIPFPQRTVHVRAAAEPPAMQPAGGVRGRPTIDPSIGRAPSDSHIVPPRLHLLISPSRRVHGHGPSPVQHPDPPSRGVCTPRCGARVDVYLRPHRLELRPHRELPDLSLRGPAPALARSGLASASSIS